MFVAIDPETLEESERVDVPAECGVVNCGWGAWRTTQFTGAHSVNSLFFSGGSGITNGGDGYYWRYDVDDNQFRPMQKYRAFLPTLPECCRQPTVL